MPIKTIFISFCLLNPQVEYHPKLCQTELRSVCEEFGVCFQAYSSLGKGVLISDPVVMEVAKNCERTTAQVNTHTDMNSLIFEKKPPKNRNKNINSTNTLTLWCLPGPVALGGAAGCSSAPQVITTR